MAPSVDSLSWGNGQGPSGADNFLQNFEEDMIQHASTDLLARKDKFRAQTSRDIYSIVMPELVSLEDQLRKPWDEGSDLFNQKLVKLCGEERAKALIDSNGADRLPAILQMFDAFIHDLASACGVYPQDQSRPPREAVARRSSSSTTDGHSQHHMTSSAPMLDQYDPQWLPSPATDAGPPASLTRRERRQMKRLT
ncbi:hypothetical protein DL546_003324 [Coniochaeta pulveracea]|uniref:Uncharacterized protein n=1 Tax=Coniochaeta pulveracea TaxID=177199 RepID=A0A420XZF2_9PEZI|nr:hypothetical protein DL546_003324 [Coniochaeta pulveracea]